MRQTASQIGGNARVDHPTVNNNFGEVSRVMTDAELSRMIELTRMAPAHVKVGSLSGDSEAYDLAKQIHAALAQAGWDVETNILFFLSGGPPQPGIKVIYKGPKSTGPTVNVSGPSPEYGLAASFANANLVYFLDPEPDEKENSVVIIVDSAPRTK